MSNDVDKILILRNILYKFIELYFKTKVIKEFTLPLNSYKEMSFRISADARYITSIANILKEQLKTFTTNSEVREFIYPDEYIFGYFNDPDDRSLLLTLDPDEIHNMDIFQIIVLFRLQGINLQDD